jgi:hypothetical protein
MFIIQYMVGPTMKSSTLFFLLINIFIYIDMWSLDMNLVQIYNIRIYIN